jgi:tRNA-intron endonuclease
MIQIEYRGQKLQARDQSSLDILRKGHFGERSGNTIKLFPEEALYLMDVRNASCTSPRGSMSFNTLALRFWKSSKFAAKYFTYKDWRDRGLVIKRPFRRSGQSAVEYKEYPGSSPKLPARSISGIFFKSDLVTITDDSDFAKQIYDDFWFGQYGSYKAADRGRLNKLDAYETVYLISKGILHVKNTTEKEIIGLATSRRKDFGSMYAVYSDWRDKGYVIKTGFKFGTHFRVYFPGAKPKGASEESSWMHSKHVIHVFPKESKMLISEWARAIRVAHSVRKTFILAVPGAMKERKAAIDFVLYHRHGGDADDPETSSPKYAMLSLSEEEYMGGSEFAAAIKAAQSLKLDLILAIADRETAVTYYKARQIRLKGSENEYYEIDWMQP